MPIHLLWPYPKGRFPRALWARVRWGRWLLVVFLVLPLTLIIFVDVPIVDRVVLPLLIFSSILSPRLIHRYARRFGHRVRENEFMNCLECGYNLRGLPDEHACPECGVKYLLPDVQVKWRDFLGDA